MKKLIPLLLALIAIAALTLTAVAEEPASISVTVTVADAGELVLVATPVTVTDVDGDGALTVNDALICAHTMHYKDGADGFKSQGGDYGLFITTLWGNTNGGSYGFYLNDTMCMSLTDAVKQGDSLYAYSYKDLTSWSDAYCYFVAETGEGEATLTLKGYGYDENWNTVSLDIAGAKITVDGQETEYVTDENGKVTVKLSTEAGRHIISATAQDKVLVPPVYAYTVGSTGDNGIVAIVIICIAALALALPVIKKAHNNEIA